MLVAKAVILLAAVVLGPIAALLVVSVGLGRVASALATRWSVTRRFAPAIRVGVSMVISFVCIFVCAMGVVIAFGAVANAEASSKATMLARGISEALRCTAFVIPPAAAAVATLFWLAWRWARRSPSPNGRT